MGWRLRKSVNLGKDLRVNIGKKGITGLTVGKHGEPHVTVNKNGATVGASIPGTGLYYSEPLKSATTSTGTAEGGINADANTMNAANPAPTQQLPPVGGSPNKHFPENGKGKGNKKPGFLKRHWKTILAAFIALIIGFAMGGGGSSNPKDSTEYRELNNSYQQLETQYQKNEKDLNQTKKDLKSAQEKADKWDKEQADLKEKQQADDQQKAQQEAAAQQDQQQSSQQALQQAQQPTQKPAQQQAAQPAKPAPQPLPAPQPATQPVPQPQPTPQEVQKPSMGKAHGGAFCTPEGAQAQSDRSSNTLTCRVASDGRLRWKN
ncbi:DUF4236 domain-containing protein [Bifidobacterium sp. ESL0745]|uniref:DUF4236 domain-containing protein n=1 Tax=Bifidobacterium sp. ESL0745 TaxID=2983226 RepID=UPI0023F62C42|nr:DUF4236 domain-containing protein [Bifidobacterium sp. ESL0745]MDF7664861.1 DUF4236 domain-containing protein [Bifidobacterium sp. ESL0745]